MCIINSLHKATSSSQSSSDKMRFVLHAVICCCVLTTVLPLVKGTAGERNATLPKRFKVWRESRVKRDLCNSSVTANEQPSDVHVGPQPDGKAKNVTAPLSVDPHIRCRRSTKNKASGCKFVTCVYHDLLHRLHQINELKPCVPTDKIKSTGYGRRRRRRSLPDGAPLALLRTGRQSPEAASKVSLAAEIQENSCRSSLKIPVN